ncbi:MAG TPA: flagellar biosynthesis anti-sigma factor FlgM [Rhodanobacteraceae bacterium]|nr:flagellar biosynthesis anti-sigma factor FlgM [Rhodanobacteraceae bacterium]
MKIDNVSHLTTPTRIDQAKSKEKVGDLAPQANGESQSATHLSRAGADTSQDIDHARVAELRQAISDGSLKMDTDRITDRLIASVRDLLGHGQ